MKSSTYASICAIMSGLGNLLLWTGYDAQVFIVESVLHSINKREPDRIGAHDGYYGLAVMNIFFMLANLVVPMMTKYMRCKWILAISAALMSFYFLTFQFLNRLLYFAACAILGCGFATFHIGYSGYITEFSTRQTLERNQAFSWSVTTVCEFGAGVVIMFVTSMNQVDGVESGYREYADSEIRYFFAAFVLVGLIGLIIYCFLPNKHVEGSIASSTVQTSGMREELASMMGVLVDKRVLMFLPFNLYFGLFFSLWVSIIPTTLQFTKALAGHIFLPAYFLMVFSFGSVCMSFVTMFLSKRINDFSFRPLMLINVVIQLIIYALILALIPQWSTVRPNDEPSLLIQPRLLHSGNTLYLLCLRDSVATVENIIPVLVLAFLFGLADAANNTNRTVISSLLIPGRRQQVYGASRFYHALSSAVLFFASPSLSVYTYVAILTAALILSTVSCHFTCSHIQREERKVSQMSPSCAVPSHQLSNDRKRGMDLSSNQSQESSLKQLC